jgi:hypothetical protein
MNKAVATKVNSTACPGKATARRLDLQDVFINAYMETGQKKRRQNIP